MYLCFDKTQTSLAVPGGGGGGGGVGGCSSEILKRTPKRDQDPLLWAWQEIFFTPKRDQIIGFN